MVTISLCMIVKDEEAVLARCLDSAAEIADEIVVVDTGSSDRTKEIAANYGRVFDFVWCDDFAAARNYSFSQATKDFLLWLDADDVITPEDKVRFLQLKQELDQTTDVVMLPYHTAFDERGRPCYTYYRERLLRRAAGFHWVGAVHECITPCGHIRYADAAVTHHKEKMVDSDRNLKIYERMLARGEKLDARAQFYYARELMTHQRFMQAVSAFENFLHRPDGWVENQIEACRNLADCLVALGERKQARQALVRSFVLDSPRGETCCALAALEMEDGRLEQSRFWYETALQVPYAEQNGAFVKPLCYGYIPCLGLCMCCDRLGRHAEAAEWNERAAVYWPDSPAVAYNRRYFADVQH
ncbi:tetratricopeptide repeat-containing glycosyltransferase family 2 protein [Agathobaculum sp. LCP25S3_E8]|uniref:tetratricopeptide repeat-containing glycosyltransferase family 2 protein n=1 Tax=Agathobaculum sp. LCP25S3_E8 TaxID=3438735 RepID=UPI003F8EC345